MNPIVKFFKFLYRIIIGDDIDTIKYVMKQHKEGKPILDPEKKRIAIQEFKKVPKLLFTESWYWLVAIVFVFCMGFLVGQQKTVVDCNNFVNEYYITPQIERLAKVTPSFTIFPSNDSHEEGEGQNQTIDYIAYIGG